MERVRSESTFRVAAMRMKEMIKTVRMAMAMTTNMAMSHVAVVVELSAGSVMSLFLVVHGFIRADATHTTSFATAAS